MHMRHRLVFSFYIYSIVAVTFSQGVLAGVTGRNASFQTLNINPIFSPRLIKKICQTKDVHTQTDTYTHSHEQTHTYMHITQTYVCMLFSFNIE